MRRWRRSLRRDPSADVDEELRYHLERRVAENIARGMAPEEARRAALERLGDLERVRVECAALIDADRLNRERRRWLSVSWLDVKLGVRMLVKYPGLSVVSVLGMAVAIAIGAGYFGAIGALLDSSLPLDEGDRVITVSNHDRSGDLGSSGRASGLDVTVWRDEAKSLEDVGAYRTERRNLMASNGSTALVDIAEMTASGFRLARVPPLFGRTLAEDDERVGAPPVVVIGYDEWRRRFDGDPDILGRTVRLGAVPHTVVGVMPEGFRFPFNNQYWVPLRLEPSSAAGARGPRLVAFGRLADGYSLGRARAELTTIGLRMAAAFPETHEHLRPRVLPYTWSFFNEDDPSLALALRGIQLAFSLLLVLVATNVAILVYARTVTRTGEIAVRRALGASRGRVVAQLFVEGLALSGTAAAIGLTMAGIALRILDAYQLSVGGGNPFWLELGLSPMLVVHSALLAIIAGGIVGVVPALKATGRRVQSGLQRLPSRGSSMQLGRTWTALIVTQVAIAVAALPAAVNFMEKSARLGTAAPAEAADELIRATLVMNRDDAGRTPDDTAAYERARRARWASGSAELIRRLEAEPDVAGVTFADRFPGSGRGYRIQVEDAAPQDTQPAVRWAQIHRVAIDLFAVFGVSTLAGRGLLASDSRDDATAVIVNETLAHRIADGANVLGRRLRYVPWSGDEAAPAPWLEIVGVVPDFADRFTAPSSFDGVAPRLYRAAAIQDLPVATLVVRTQGGVTPEFAARFRNIAGAVEPTLVLERMQAVTGAWRREQKAFVWLALGIVAVTLSVLLLSAAGIYAMMSFTVARRRREIGIRSALGADPRRILTGVFARASAQLGTGILAGLLIAGGLDHLVTGDLTGDRAALLLPAVALLMLTIGLAAALGPARRGLAVQPTEALREE